MSRLLYTIHVYEQTSGLVTLDEHQEAPMTCALLARVLELVVACSVCKADAHGLALSTPGITPLPDCSHAPHMTAPGQ